MKSISIIIPVYNGEHWIEKLESFIKVSMEMRDAQYEIIFIDDGSTDDSWDKIRCIAQGNCHCSGLRFAKNYGQHNATTAGIINAKHEIIVTMDQDLQHKADDIWILYQALEQGADLVYGIPRKLPNAPIRNVLTALAKKSLSFVTKQHALKQISAFRLFDAKLRKYLAAYSGPSIILDVVLMWGARYVRTVQVDIEVSDSSNYSYLSLLRVTMRVLISFSTAPLKLGSWLGFGMTLIGIAVLAYVVVVYVTIGSIPGFTFLASLITIFGGAQMFVFGIFGEYLAKIFESTLGKPLFNIVETTTD